MAERSTMETPEPEIDWISVVSAVRRESTSPTFVTSKNAWVFPLILPRQKYRYDVQLLFSQTWFVLRSSNKTLVVF